MTNNDQLFLPVKEQASISYEIHSNMQIKCFNIKFNIKF